METLCRIGSFSKQFLSLVLFGYGMTGYDYDPSDNDRNVKWELVCVQNNSINWMGVVHFSKKNLIIAENNGVCFLENIEKSNNNKNGHSLQQPN